jgi:hypothetical protein
VVQVWNWDVPKVEVFPLHSILRFQFNHNELDINVLQLHVTGLRFDSRIFCKWKLVEQFVLIDVVTLEVSQKDGT